jgi:RNase P subunit RPR2
MILRDCDTCERRTVQNRRQRAEGENGQPVIRTEYTCTECGTIETNLQEFETADERSQRDPAG